MISASSIVEVVEKFIADSGLFLVGVTITPSNEIEVLVDRSEGLDISECVNISRAIEAAFDREAEDYELTVGSPGLSEPLKVLPQYHKLLGKEVEILLKSGVKLVATLCSATSDGIAVEYKKKEAVEGNKRKQLVTHTQELKYDEMKWAKAYIKV